MIISIALGIILAWLIGVAFSAGCFLVMLCLANARGRRQEAAEKVRSEAWARSQGCSR